MAHQNRNSQKNCSKDHLTFILETTVGDTKYIHIFSVQPLSSNDNLKIENGAQQLLKQCKKKTKRKSLLEKITKTFFTICKILNRIYLAMSVILLYERVSEHLVRICKYMFHYYPT